MKIIVCVKQVPFIGDLSFDIAAGRVVREGATNVLNAFDRPAVVAAVETVRERGGEVVALTMGPPAARDALLECLAIGADRAIHLCDPAFAGSDTLATARTLAAAIRRDGGADLIWAGRNSTDSDTGQIGPMLAELLDLPQATDVVGFELRPDRRTAIAEREIDGGFETVEVRLPALLTAAERLRPAPTLTVADRDRAADRPIELVTAVDLGLAAADLGAAGSPTSVGRAYSIAVDRAGRMIDGTDAEAAARELAHELIARGLFDAVVAEEPPLPAWPSRGRPPWPITVMVVVELARDGLHPASFELLGRGAELAAARNGAVVAVRPAPPSGEGLPGWQPRAVRELSARGADAILLAHVADAAAIGPEEWASQVVRSIQQAQPEVVLIPATTFGREYAPRVAARLGLGLTGDCLDVEWAEAGRLRQLKPAFGDSVIAPIYTRTSPVLATVRPGVLRPLPPDPTRRARHPIRAIGATTDPGRARILARSLGEDDAGASLRRAPVIVAVGGGVGPPDKYGPVHDLASLLGAPLGASRKVTDRGWLPRSRQIGLTGRTVAPRFYFAIGVRGVSHHAVGIRRAGVVVAINDSATAPIWKLSDLGIRGDWAAIVPALTRALRELRPGP